ncbi:MAG: glycine/serine hydroxymethyltransferase [Gammaproteobacteria bacterium]|jgi:glycine/serine hydroxymethyltransferase|nr:glycine/serine hydroxymethyltransferase [Gammaproteobacteria bacterium]
MQTNKQLSPQKGPVTCLKHYSLIEQLIREEQKDNTLMNLCAYDNVLSKVARYFLQSPLGFRYRLGQTTQQEDAAVFNRKNNLFLHTKPGLSSLESAAHLAAIRLFSGVSADFRPLSGVHATLCSILALTKPGDTVLSITPNDGGHFATSAIAKTSGRNSAFLPWDKEKDDVDFAALASSWNSKSPLPLIILEHGSPQRPLNLKKLRDIVGRKTIIIYDASHSLGLIAGGLFQSPLKEGCDIIQANTHKSFPGPQKGLFIFGNHEVAKKITNALDQALISSQHTHNLMALCITLLEMEQWAEDYAQKMIENAIALKKHLKILGFDVLYPEEKSTHIILLDLGSEAAGKKVFEQLLSVGILTNLRMVGEKAIMRLGTQEITRRGFEPYQMVHLSDLIAQTLHSKKSSQIINDEVISLMHSAQHVHYSFDDNAWITQLINGDNYGLQH